MAKVKEAKRVKIAGEIEEELIRLLGEEDKALREGKIKREYKADWFRNEIAKRLHLSENENPALRTYQLHLDKKREILKVLRDSPQEKPWSLGSLRQADMPADAVSAVLAVQKWEEGQRQLIMKDFRERIVKFKKVLPKEEWPAWWDKPEEPKSPLTVRQAWWIARLYKVVKGATQEEYLENLSDVAFFYAQYEIASGLSEKPFDSFKLDLTLSEDKFDPNVMEDVYPKDKSLMAALLNARLDDMADPDLAKAVVHQAEKKGGKAK